MPTPNTTTPLMLGSSPDVSKGIHAFGHFTLGSQPLHFWVAMGLSRAGLVWFHAVETSPDFRQSYKKVWVQAFHGLHPRS
jgi:hypothetical protein